MMGNKKPAGADGGRGHAATVCANGRCPHYSTIFINMHGQVVGRLAVGWLVKRVHRRKHQLRQPPAWCVDLDHLDRLEAMGANGVCLIDEVGTEWRATVRAFRRFGLVIERGHGVQVALPLAYWHITPAGQLPLPLPDLGGGAP